MTKARTLADFDSSNVLTGNINLTSQVTGTLPVANGGTALSSGFINGGATSSDVGFSARVSTSTTLPHGTTTTVGFTNEVLDTNNMYNNATSTFTAPSAGKYLIGTAVHFLDSQGNMTKQELFLKHNAASNLIARVDIASNTALMTNETQTWAGIIDASQGDTFNIQARIETGDSSGAETSNNYASNFWAIKFN